MNKDLEKAIDALAENLNVKLREVAQLKQTINMLCTQIGQPPRFPDEDLVQNSIGHATRPDAYFNMPLATAAGDFLKRLNRAATVDEIYDGLQSGGFSFQGKDPKKNLRISLTKNAAKFAYVKANDSFGLWEFYGGKPGKERPASSGEREGSDASGGKTSGEGTAEEQ